MTEKEKRAQRRREEDATFNRMLIWIGGAVAAEIIALLIKRLYVDFGLSDAALAVAGGLGAFFKVFQFLGIVLVAAGIVWSVMWAKRGQKLRLPVICTGAALYVWIFSLLAYQLYDVGMRILMVLPAVAAVLVLIFFLYQRAFFVNAILTGGGMAALWLSRQYYLNHPRAIIVCFVAGWVVLVLAVVVAWKLRGSGGKLGKLRLMPENSNYLTSYLTCGITAVAMLLGLLLGAGAAYYLIFVLVGWLFCQAVYFTVKLM